jgi:hypothetical protein
MTFTLNTGNLYICPPELALQEAILVLSRLVRDPTVLDSHVLPTLDKAESAENWYVAYRHDDPDCSYSLQVFVWPSGSATKIHDHSSWGAFCCVVGSVLEERYERADDGSLPDYARLKSSGGMSGEGKMGSLPCCRMRAAFTGWVTRPKSQPSQCTFTVPGMRR